MFLLGFSELGRGDTGDDGYWDEGKHSGGLAG